MNRVFVTAVLSMSLSAAVAQEASSVQQLTYPEAIRMGLEKNVLLNQQKNTLFSREVQRNQSRAAVFSPSVYAQGRASRNEGQQQNPENGNFENLTIDNVGAQVAAEWTIFGGLSNMNVMRQYSQLFKSQTSLVKRGEQDVMALVTSQYLQVLLDQELLRIAKENYVTQKTVLDQLTEQVNLGSKAESDKYTQEAQVRNMELIALRAEVTLNNDKAILSQTLQFDPAVAFEVAFPDATPMPPDVAHMSIDSLYQIALEHREDLKQQDYLMHSYQFSYRSAMGGYLPRVTLFANYGSVYYSNFSADFKQQFWRLNPSTNYGVNFYIPIYDRLTTRNNRVLNRVQYDNSRLQYENLEKAIKIDVQRAVNNYKAAIQAYQSSQTQFQAGELALKTQQESFLLGVSDQVALAQANQTYVVAAASRAQAEVTLAFQQILLEYALGTLTSETLK